MVAGVREFSLAANMENFTWKMYNETSIFGDMRVNGLTVQYEIAGAHTAIELQLRDIQINYIGIGLTQRAFNHAFKPIIRCARREHARRNFLKLNINFYNVDKIPASRYSPEVFRD